MAAWWAHRKYPTVVDTTQEMEAVEYQTGRVPLFVRSAMSEPLEYRAYVYNDIAREVQRFLRKTLAEVDDCMGKG